MTDHALQYRDQTVPLPRGDFYIGRSPDCDLVIQDRMVSRKHVVIRVHERGIELEDCGSRNGALLNGFRIKGRETLREGDLLKLGKHEFRLTTLAARRRARKQTSMSVTRKVRPYRAPRQAPDEAMSVDNVSEAISAGEYEQAEAALRRILEWLRPRVRTRTPDRSMLDEITEATIEFGDNTRQWQLLSTALGLYQLLEEPPPDRVLQQIEARADTMPHHTRHAVRVLAARLETRKAEMDHGKRETVERLISLGDPPEGSDDPTLVGSNS